MNDLQRMQRLELRILELEAEIRRRDEGHVCPRMPDPAEYALELVKRLEHYAYPQRWIINGDLMGDGTGEPLGILNHMDRIWHIPEEARSGTWIAEYERAFRERVEDRQSAYASTIGTAIHEAMEKMNERDETVDEDGADWLTIGGQKLAVVGEQYRIKDGEHLGRIGFVSMWPRDEHGQVTTPVDPLDPVIPLEIYGKPHNYPLSQLEKIEQRPVKDTPQA